MKSPILVLLASLFVASSAMATPPIHVPWPCDTTYSITQGHNTGSHTGKGGWAWDIGIPVGGEVVAPADGVVRRVKMDSNTGGCNSSYGNEGNYVIIQFDDGTEALMLHLAQGSSGLKPGDQVTQGQFVGRVGLTGWVCGAHLHFQIQNTCSSYWCQSISSNFVEFGNPTSGSFKSNNCAPPPECGAIASLTESLTIDEQDAGCFRKQTSYWWSSASGDGGHHYYTYATLGDQHETSARWLFDVESDGSYVVEAFIPGEAKSTNARYTVFSGESEESVRVDQSQYSGWVTLGAFDLKSGADRWIQLGDASGESPDDRIRVGFDAVRLTAVEPEPEPDPILDIPAMQNPELGPAATKDSETDTAESGDADPQLQVSEASCSTTLKGRNTGGGLVFAAFFFGLILRRRK